MDVEAIAAEAAGWEGVERHGGELRFRGRELGRLEPGRVEVAIHPGLARMLVETGRAEPHARPDRVQLALAGEDDAAEAVELLRLAWERARVAEQVRKAQRVRRAAP